MKIGLHAAMLERRFPNPADALTQAAALGADLYEIDVGIGKPGEAWGARFEAWRRAAPEVRARADAAGVRLPSLCLGVLWQLSLASPDEGEREAGVRVVRDCCGLAETLGATALLLPVGQPEGLEVGRARANVVRSLGRCVESAEDAGVTLALENVCQELLSTADDLLEVVEEVDSPACGVYYDLGNPTFIGVDPVVELPKVASRLVRVHAKDTVPVPRHVPLPETPITGDFTVWGRRTTVTLGTGEVDFGTLRGILSDIRYTAGVVLEVPQPAETALTGCRDNLAAARRLFTG